MLEELKERVLAANLDLVAKGVVIYTWGNVSEIDRERGLVVIKPSGVDYAAMSPEDMSVIDLEGQSGGRKMEAFFRYADTSGAVQGVSEIGGVTHTHSTNAVASRRRGSRSLPWERRTPMHFMEIFRVRGN